MPVGPEPIGFAYFAAVKAAGYTAASVILKKRIWAAWIEQT